MYGLQNVLARAKAGGRRGGASNRGGESKGGEGKDDLAAALGPTVGAEALGRLLWERARMRVAAVSGSEIGSKNYVANIAAAIRAAAA